jgi:hypothetical protein
VKRNSLCVHYADERGGAVAVELLLALALTTLRKPPREKEKENHMSNSEQHKQLVKKLLDTKAVDFNAIGKVIAEAGPSLSLAEEPGDFFCGTNRIFVHIYKVFSPGVPVEDLSQLGANAAEMRGRSS